MIIPPQESGLTILQAEEVEPGEVSTLGLHYRDGVPVLVGAEGGAFPAVIQLIDGSGNILAAYTANQVQPKRLDVTSGDITTVSGVGVAGFSGDAGPAMSARLYYPQGVEVGQGGDVYIADSSNHRVR
ncbi:hypothetical protein GCM10010388_49350 [Streptomyces mauvecolor]